MDHPANCYHCKNASIKIHKSRKISQMIEDANIQCNARSRPRPHLPTLPSLRSLFVTRRKGATFLLKYIFYNSRAIRPRVIWQKCRYAISAPCCAVDWTRMTQRNTLIVNKCNWCANNGSAVLLWYLTILQEEGWRQVAANWSASTTFQPINDTLPDRPNSNQE